MPPEEPAWSYATIENEKRSSIELARNAKGEFSYHVKFYFDDDGAGLNMQAAMSRVQALAAELDAKYMRNADKVPF